MSNLISDLWKGEISPCEHCGAHDAVLNGLNIQVEKYREELRRGLNGEQERVFQEFLDCSEDYLLRLMELCFCDGFSMGGKLVAEVLIR